MLKDHLINLESKPQEILDAIASLREKTDKGEVTLKLINNAINVAHDYIVRLYFEKILVYQHEVMQDRGKPETKQDKRKQSRYIRKMEETTKEIQEYTRRNKLQRWESRIQRFLGRVSDYKKDYSKAITYYKKAIAKAKKDPAWVNERVPYWLEYEAFLAFSLLMSGKIKKGISLSKKTYEKFENTKEGKSLKRRDYPTWAIWKTGIPIRVGFWFLEKKDGLTQKEILSWLSDTESIIRIPRGSKRWVGKVDFQFRKDEISTIRRKLRQV